MSGFDRRRRFAMVVAAFVVVAVVAAFGYGLVSLFVGAPGSRPAASSTGTPAGDPAAAAALPYSVPTRLSIPSIGVDGGLQQVGVDSAKNTLQLPAKVAQAAWFTGSKAPGQVGPTVLVGYISSGAKKPGVFAKMAGLKPGGEIRVSRTDGKTVVYQVDSITEYPLNKMPTDKVFATTAAPSLRIITCGGSLRSAETASNVVVFAHMTRTA